MNSGYRILAVVAHFNGNLMDLVAALLTQPHKPIFLARFAFALKDNEPGVLLHPGRVRHPARAEQHLASLDNRGLLFSFRREVNETLHAAQLQRYFIAGIDVEILSPFATAAKKREGFGILPKDSAPFALRFDLLDYVFEIDRDKLLHKRPPRRIYRLRERRANAILSISIVPCLSPTD